MYILIFILLILPSSFLHSRTMDQHNADRRVLESRIQNIHKILKNNKHQQVVSTGQLKAINQELKANQQLVHSITYEINELDRSIFSSQKRVARLENNLVQLQQEYRKMVYLGAKSLSQLHPVLFILATRDFYSFAQRLDTIRQYAPMRKKHLRELARIVNELQQQRNNMTSARKRQDQLLTSRNFERKRLQQRQLEQVQVKNKLGQQQHKLEHDLKVNKQALNRIEQLINRTLENSRSQDNSPGTSSFVHEAENKHLSGSFKKLRGKLPWPVKIGFICQQFGIHPHPVLTNIQVESKGVDIQTQTGSKAYPVFKGVVRAVAFVPGIQTVVIIQHGAYRSVYARLNHVTVQTGQSVTTDTELGVIHTDNQGNTELQFQIWDGIQPMNPKDWLIKH